MERFAHFFGYESRDAFAERPGRPSRIVQGHYSRLFEGDPAGTEKLPDVDYGAGPEDQRLLDHLLVARLQEAGDGRDHQCSNG